MSYTNTELVRQHVLTPYPVSLTVRDQALCLTGADYLSFYHGAVDGASCRVKAVRSATLSRTQVTLAEAPVSFSAQAIIPGSVVVASDSSLGTVYTENADYVIDYSNATIATKNGLLSAAEAVTLWFIPFTLYQLGIDYALDDKHGRLKRIVSGDIADGETILLDYTPLSADVSDSLIEGAVTMANGMIETEVDPGREFEANRTLEAAATYRALEIVCRAAAGRELSRLSGEDRAALAWLKLADDYRQRTATMITNFRPPADKLRPPTRS